MIYQHNFSTALGEVICCVFDDKICFFDFLERKHLIQLLNDLKKRLNSDIILKQTPLHQKAQEQITQYFNKEREVFDLPLSLNGTVFQERVWQELLKIPYAQTITYLQQAQRMGIEKSVRAVANANGRNKLSILIPCHRVVGGNGSLGGYGGGIFRKIKLIELEKR